MRLRVVVRLKGADSYCETVPVIRLILFLFICIQFYFVFFQKCFY